MADKAYIIAVDAWNTEPDVTALKDYIRTSPSISNWWNYIPCVFLVMSPMSADELSDALKPHTRDASLLVIEANLRNSEGWLPERAWKWIKRRQRQEADGAKVVVTSEGP